METAIQASLFGSERFRALSPEPFFGADMRFHNCDRSEIESVLAHVAKTTNETLSGYLTESGESMTYHLSRYPRRRFGNPPSDQQLEQCLQELRSHGAERGISLEVVGESKSARDEIRVVLGLQEGYLETKKQSVLKLIKEDMSREMSDSLARVPSELAAALKLSQYTFDTTEQLAEFIAAAHVSVLHSSGEVGFILGASCRVVPSDILTVGPWGVYSEPAAIILAPHSELDSVLELAECFHQERIAIERLGAGDTYMVETVHCSDRDPK